MTSVGVPMVGCASSNGKASAKTVAIDTWEALLAQQHQGKPNRMANT